MAATTALAVDPLVLADLRLLHSSAEPRDLDLAIERALQHDPSFERGRREEVRVHDWRQHVGAGGPLRLAGPAASVARRDRAGCGRRRRAGGVGLNAPAHPFFPLASLLETQDPDHDAAWSARTRPGWAEWTAGADPVHVHHGTAHEGFSTFALSGEGSIGFHFGTIDAAVQQARAAADDECEARVASCLVLARNPLRTCDLGLWDTREVLSELGTLGIIGERARDHLESQFCGMSLLAAVEAAGYDSIVYSNRTEDPGSDSWLLWRASNIRSVHCARFVIGDPRLCPTLDMSDHERAWNRENERVLDEQVSLLREMARTDVFHRDIAA